MSASKKLTEAQRRKMRHALGLDQGAVEYRNYYKAAPPDQPDWEELVALGYAISGMSDKIGCGYAVTDAGRAALAEAEKE